MNRSKFLVPMTILPIIAGCCSNPERGSKQQVSSVDYILVEKSQQRLTVFNNDEILGQYFVALSKSPIGHKEREGDFKTPEGIYKIAHKVPNSKYYKALTISYPNEQDRENALKRGYSPGGGIQIHGYDEELAWVTQDHYVTNGSRGCIVLSNPEMEMLYKATDIGTTIEIRA